MAKYYYSYRFIIVFIALSTLLFSCKKTLQEDINPSQKTKAIFKISGIKENTTKSFLANSNSLGKNNSSSNQAKKNITQINNNVSLEVFEETDKIESSLQKSINQSVLKNIPNSKELNKLANTNPLNIVSKYRVVILDNQDNIVGTAQGSASEEITLDLEIGEEYRWYAYSYDDDQDIAVPSNENQIIETPTNRDLLYVKSPSSFIAIKGSTPINIVFEHRLAMISIELDYDRLFAQIPGSEQNVEDISSNFNWTFDDVPDFLYKGDFSLKNGNITNQQLYVPDINTSLKDHPTKKNTKVAQLYTVQPPLGATPTNSFAVSINLLKIRYPNTPEGETVSLFATPISKSFPSFSNEPGKKYVARFKLWYAFSKLNILHVGRNSTYSYAAEPKTLSDGASSFNSVPSQNRAAFNMIKAERNFGRLTNSLVMTNGFGHRRLSNDERIDTALHLNANPANPNEIQAPDIVIIGVYYKMDANDVIALTEYVNRGGVLLLMTDGVNSADYRSHRPFFQSLFGNSNVTIDKAGHSGGSMYKLADHNDEILNGPFGDIRNKHWGEDASETMSLQNYPPGDVIKYSDSNPVNRTPAVSNGATMIRHKRKHFFWIGDGGFIASDEVSGSHGSPSNPTGGWSSYANQPFATATAPDKATRKHPYPYLSTHYEFFPVPRPFGSSGNGFSTYQLSAYNSTVFANFMSWAVVNASFFGINTGGLNPSSYYDF